MMTLKERTDDSVHERLRAQGGERLLLALTASFLERSPGILEQLEILARSAAEAGVEQAPEPWREGAQIAHSFKTSCRMLGALHMGQRLEALEWQGDPDPGAAAAGGLPEGAEGALGADADERPMSARVEEIVAEFAHVKPWIERAHAAAQARADAGAEVGPGAGSGSGPASNPRPGPASGGRP
jgi:HPt (histidine-containing phosphotransfer) domain-containing protein